LLQNSQQQQQPYDDDDDDGNDGRGCREYGYVDEAAISSSSSSSAATAAAAAGDSRGRRAVICGDERRDKLVGQSNANVLHVVLNRPPTNASTDPNFLLRFYGMSHELQFP